MLTAEVRQVMNGRICSHCAKHTHFSHRVSHSFTFRPHTGTHTHTKSGSSGSTVLRLLFSFSLLQPCLIPRGIWRSPVLGELRVSGGKRRSGREELQVATSENLSEPPTAHQHAGGNGASGKGYHGNTIQCIIKE